MKRISIRESWNAISRPYQRRTRISTEDVHYGALAPGEKALRLLGEVKEKLVLELGCGGGQNTIALAKWGAKAVGLDLSEAQIEYARILAERERVRARFYVRPMENLDIFDDSSQDIVLSSFTVAYVEDLTRVFGEVFRVLKAGGLFVFCDLHPLASRGRAAKLKERWVWIVGDYFKRGPMFWYWPKFHNGTTAKFCSYHHTVQDYVEALVEAGFLVERILEPEPYNLPAMTREEKLQMPCYAPDVAKDYRIWRKIPYTIIFKARKPLHQL